MKYMKLGTKPDTFYTEKATRTVLSDVPTDLVIQINNTKYLLHKTHTAKSSQKISDSAAHSYHFEGKRTSNPSNFPLILKCNLLQRLYSDSSSPSSSSSSLTTSTSPLILPDFPGGEDAFELCAKFCYNISITLSAHNFISAFTAAKFLIMTDSVSQPNLLPKLHTFFLSFILPNWKDSIITLVSSSNFSPPFSEPIIIRPLIDSIVSKILTPTSQVTWSFTYSREIPKSSVPKDWWTEDVADLDLNHFRSILSSLRSTNILPPALIGEALHVYTVKNLLDPNETVHLQQLGKERRVLEAIVSMVPLEAGAVSGGFLMRLLKIAILVGASASVKAELVRRVGRQLDEVLVRDLVFYRKDFGLIEAVVESFLEPLRRKQSIEKDNRERLARVAKVFEEYLMVVARDGELSIEKFIQLVELVPDMAREEHDGLYRAIDTFLEEHPELSKADRKRLCQLIDCRKLSLNVRSQAITNDRLPLRTLVQLLFVEQERASGTSGGQGTLMDRKLIESSNAMENHNQLRKSRQGQEEQRHRHIEEPICAKGGKKGEGSGNKPQPKSRREGDAEKKKIAKRPG